MAELFADGEKDLVRELIETFVADSTERIQALKDAWSRGDLTSVRSGAHSLKGSCGQMGAHAMVRLCQTMEALAREEKVAEGQALVDGLSKELDTVQAAFRNYLFLPMN
jgi:HPt (histidine-containing phosphotransfer) domain-containing protein